MSVATKCRAKDPAACTDPNCPERKAFYEEFGFTFAKEVEHGKAPLAVYRVDDHPENDGAVAATFAVRAELQGLYGGSPVLRRFAETGELDAHAAMDELVAADRWLVAGSKQSSVDRQNLLKTWVNEVIIAQGGSAREVPVSVLPEPVATVEKPVRKDDERRPGYRWGYDKKTGDYGFGIKR